MDAVAQDIRELRIERDRALLEVVRWHWASRIL
ncbi:hypothetical protein R2601_04273 [Salipiger bermudensis HTCC2601]|uniref:Uncharacterized protein n=1 Tax=Salipiger bermudensis (strain DSM 26914 / JCM 13377 / KCTC 12554 / HTCC2601) TaxID=314265 RepID=Q0FVZ1_SALBH|nr:hypothetical protein R2601_04273 [Salipiger bermudensis HTCC2601]